MKEQKARIPDFQCRCKEPRIREVAYCEECLGGFPSMLSVRGRDSCTSTHGITDYDIVDDRKIYRCNHYVYCPLCGWRCESEEDLEKHLDATDYDGKRICDGAWRYGASGINQVKNELKYWRIYQRQKRVISELKLALSCLETFKKKNNWKLLGFEIPIHNANRWLRGEK